MPLPPSRSTTTVVICAYTLDRWSDVLAAIESARGQDPAPDEVLAVVDHNPALAHRLEAEGTGARVVESTGPRGLSGARNTGVREATGDIVVFLDDDARARPGWLAALLDAYALDVIAVGGAAVPAWDGGRPAWFPDEFDWVVGCTYRGSPTRRAPVRNVIGSNMSFRRSALAAAGAFESRLGRVGTKPVGAEETELCIRARRAMPGHRILLEPASVVDHRVPAARASIRYFLARCVAEGTSKAVVVDVAGAGDGLETERAYVRRTLPAGILRGAGQLLRGDVDGGRRAAAIVLGLAATTTGFVAGRAQLLASGMRGTRVPSA